MRPVAKVIEEALNELTAVQRSLHMAIRDIGWAQDDLRAGNAKLPIEPPDGLDREACFLEFAARTVLPMKLPEIVDNVQRILDDLKEVATNVHPLPEIPSGQAQADL